MKTPIEVFKSFSRRYDQRKVLKQLRQYLRASGIQLVYAVLLLYQAYQQPDTPSWAKRMVLGALAYVLAPIDGIPDLAPFFGFTDDLGVLMFGLVSIAGHIDAEVKAKARGQLKQWFGAVNPDDLVEIERKIG